MEEENNNINDIPKINGKEIGVKEVPINSPNNMESPRIKKSQEAGRNPTGIYIWVGILVVIQILIILFLGLFFKFGKLNHPKNYSEESKEESNKEMANSYGLFQDVHVMVFVGFGFLYTYLKNHSWTSVAINFFLAAFTIEFSLLTLAFFHCAIEDEWAKIELDLSWIINADFAAATVLVSLGGIIGKFSFPQYFLLVILETIFCSLNYRVGEESLHAIDAGGSMYIHSFGAFFGVALTWVMYCGKKDKIKGNKNNGSSYVSNTFAFIGTNFLWMYWPSFNTALLSGHSRYRGIINTYLSMVGSCMSTFIVSLLVKRGKLNIEDILNASVSGGVIIGGPCNVVINPFASLTIGFCGGVISTLCFEFLSPFVQKHLSLFDTAGILNLHGIPGFLGGILTSIFASSVSHKRWGEGYSEDFEKLVDRSPSKQAGFQLAALFTTLGISLAGGAITGLLLNLPCLCPIEKYFVDSEYWEEEEGENEENKFLSLKSTPQEIELTYPNAQKEKMKTETNII